LLAENFARYGKRLFIAETVIEDEARPAWLRYLCNEVFAAIADGVPVEGVCLYPVLNHPGWDDDRHCHNGLIDYASDEAGRQVYEPLAKEIARQREILAQLRAGAPFLDRRKTDVSALDWAAHVMQERTDESRTAEET
jgi:hypothetical protein